MCFSASASFGVSAILLVGGIITVKKTGNPSQLPFAAIPIIFSIQQFTEGILWLSLTNPVYEGWQQSGTYIFLVFAQVVWPIWVPFSMYLLEQDPKRKKILAVILSFGATLAAYLAYCLLFYNIQSSVSDYHIGYHVDFPLSKYPLIIRGIVYIIPTIIPSFISSVKKMNLIGITLSVSFIISRIFYEENVISVWCFFAATISVIVLYVIATLQIPKNLPKFAT